jgi:hypothetical protein
MRVAETAESESNLDRRATSAPAGRVRKGIMFSARRRWKRAILFVSYLAAKCISALDLWAGGIRLLASAMSMG